MKKAFSMIEIIVVIVIVGILSASAIAKLHFIKQSESQANILQNDLYYTQIVAISDDSMRDDVFTQTNNFSSKKLSENSSYWQLMLPDDKSYKVVQINKIAPGKENLTYAELYEENKDSDNFLKIVNIDKTKSESDGKSINMRLNRLGINYNSNQRYGALHAGNTCIKFRENFYVYINKITAFSDVVSDNNEYKICNGL